MMVYIKIALDYVSCPQGFCLWFINFFFSSIYYFDNTCTDLSATQQQLLDVNQRYDVLGQKLTDRQTELESGRRTVVQYHEELQDVLAWLEDKEQLILPLKSLPASESEAADKLKEHQVTVSVFFTAIFKDEVTEI